MAEKHDRIRLAHPTGPAEAMRAFQQILESGRWTQGEFGGRFTEELAAYFHANHVVLFNSGTSALFGMLKASGIGPGHRVAVPDYGFVATANAVELAGATPVFCDVGEADFGIAPDGLGALDPKPDAVIVVHLFGLPAKTKSVKTWAAKTGVRVFEDSACALGTSVRGNPLGFAGEAAALSFHPRKIVSTGEGGAILTDSQTLAEKAASLASHGFVRGGDVESPGMNLRLPELSAALGSAMLSELPKIVVARSRVRSWYAERLAAEDRVTLPAVAEDVVWNVQTMVAVLDGAIDRDNVIARLSKNGIEANAPAKSISQMRYYRDHYGIDPAELTASGRLDRQALGLPCHDRLTEKHVDRVCAALLDALDAQ